MKSVFVIVISGKQNIYFYILLAAFVLFNVACLAQQQYNLVPNYSFEQYTNCPSNATLEASKNSKPDIWYKPDLRNAVYYNACANNNMDGVPVNFFFGGGYGFSVCKNRKCIYAYVLLSRV